MKKWIVGIIAGIVLIGGAVGIAIWWHVLRDDDTVVIDVEQFRLSEEYYEESKVQPITAKEFQQKLQAGESFVVIVRMVVCPAEFPITTIAKELTTEEEVTFLELTEAEFKQTALAEKIQYLPSAAIYHNGSLVKFLDAESDSDIEYYKSASGLKKWLVQNGVEL